MSKNVTIKSVVPAGTQGSFSLPEHGVKLYLNPAESTLLRDIYAHESRFGSHALQEDALVSLCSESKRVFYSNISRIKRKFVDAIGARKARGYYIKRYPNGLYRTLATLTTAPPHQV